MSTPTAAERIASVEARRQKLREGHAAAHAEQLAIDMEALVELEAEHGFDQILRIDLSAWKAGVGAATMVAARVPLASESVFRRFEQTVSKAKSGTSSAHDASQTLARSCLVYPSEKSAPELYAATMELAPGVLSHLALQVVKAVQGNAEEEKKG